MILVGECDALDLYIAKCAASVLRTVLARGGPGHRSARSIEIAQHAKQECL